MALCGWAPILIMVTPETEARDPVTGTVCSTRQANHANLLLPEGETESQTARTLAQSLQAYGRVLPACSPARWRGGRRGGRGFLEPPSPISPCFRPSRQAGLRLRGSGNICECPGFYTSEPLCGSPAFPSIHSSPREQPGEKDGSEPLSGPSQEEAWSAKAGAAIRAQRLLHTHFLSPPGPRRLWQSEKRPSIFFFPSSLLTQTHLDFICLRVFHFLFWKAVRVLPVPFITGGCVTLKEHARKAENPALTRAGAGLPPTPLRPR